MSTTVRVNFHCHSTASDGDLEPAELAQRLARDGVRFAALTDHDTLDGCARFAEAAAREGMTAIAGFEIVATSGGRDVHLLAYGFEPAHEELAALLARTRGAGQENGELGSVLLPGRRLPPASELCRIVHDAGGIIVLAHPLTTEPDEQKLRVLVTALRADGLDAVEAIYAQYGDRDIEWLCALAAELHLSVCAGTDYHREGPLGVQMPRPLWEQLRSVLLSRAHVRSRPASPAPGPLRRRLRLDVAGFLLRIVLPTLVAMALLVAPLFAFIVPAFEDALLTRKREMIRELTNSAVSILSEYREDERTGRTTHEQAQEAAISRIRHLRYGNEGKDYFWITDMQPRMVMHPYRTDLEGKDLSDYRDPAGNRVFMEFLRAVTEHREGYVEYIWQWKDDPARLAPKQSYVKGFEPWGWVIGTGIYIEDVRAEISTITRRIVHLSAGMALLIGLLLAFVAHQSLRIEAHRTRAEDALHESHEKYRALVEASKEGTMLIVDGRITYANRTLLGLLDYDDRDLLLLEPSDLFVQEQAFGPDAQASLAGEPAEVRLKKRDGTEVEALLTVHPLTLGGKHALSLVVRDLDARPKSHLGSASSSLLWSPDPFAVEHNPLQQLLGRVRTAVEPGDLAQCQRALAEIVQSLVAVGSRPRTICRAITAVADAVLERLIVFACAELGKAPAPYAFLVLGSQGREDQTLATDQDNAIVFDPDEGADTAALETYFHRLGEKVCDGLATVGYPYCAGLTMAKTPSWCLSLPSWKRQASTWIATAEPKDVLGFSTFFDFRSAHGDEALAGRLRRHVLDEIARTPTFLTHLAKGAPVHKPLLGFFGNIVAGTQRTFNLKDATLPITSFARLYALHNGLPATSTFDRLDHLEASDVLPSDVHREIVQAYDVLMLLRLRHQAEALLSGRAATNDVAMASLTAIDEAMLKQVLALVASLQGRIAHDFLGGPYAQGA